MSEPFLSVRDLHRPGLQPTSFQVHAGECVAVMGTSGSGKTLLLRAIADLDPNRGSATLEGESRESVPAPTWRRWFTYVPAESGWWATRVGDHFDEWKSAERFLTELLLSEASPEWSVSRLSTGERQRLSLARALVGGPRVLLLDEPTSGLDEAARDAVETLLEKFRGEGAAILWVTHDRAQARRVARRCLFVEDGQVSEGTP